MAFHADVTLSTLSLTSSRRRINKFFVTANIA
jgi:hypothetical protein